MVRVTRELDAVKQESMLLRDQMRSVKQDIETVSVDVYLRCYQTFCLILDCHTIFFLCMTVHKTINKKLEKARKYVANVFLSWKLESRKQIFRFWPLNLFET